MNQLTDSQRQAIENEILAGRTIGAIKLYRQATGVGLADAKHAVEDMEVTLRRVSPEKFRAGAGTGKSGCFGMVLGIALAVAAVGGVVAYFLRQHSHS